ncbi:MAG: hypothetical protein J6B82_07020, partial [Bacteroidaceae bacterium]|nr:hypothetical protein [Bacteroidaceae bacterium]
DDSELNNYNKTNKITRLVTNLTYVAIVFGQSPPYIRFTSSVIFQPMYLQTLKEEVEKARKTALKKCPQR